MVIRDDSGKVIENDSVSVAHAYRAHLNAADRIFNDSVEVGLVNGLVKVITRKTS